MFFFDSGNHRVRRISAGTISTVVGNGSAGFSGDGGAATAASIDFITQLALDGSGNLYLADGNQRRVRKVTGGTITTVAGNGSATFSGDGGAATSAGLDSVGGITVDNSGSLYLSSQTRVRKVTSGTITTIAGGPTSGFAGDGGPAATAQLSMASALSAAGSGLYLLDANRVRRIDTGGTITTVVGNGSAALRRQRLRDDRTARHAPGHHLRPVREPLRRRRQQRPGASDHPGRDHHDGGRQRQQRVLG